MVRPDNLDQGPTLPVPSRGGFTRRFVLGGVTALLALAAEPYLSSVPSVRAATGPVDFSLSIPGVMTGHFYTQTRGKAPYPAGYGVVDDQAAPFWITFQKFGGAATWGPPISGRWTDGNGRICQAFQRGIFQLTVNKGVVGNVEWANVLDELGALGKNQWLDVNKQIPPPFDWSSDQGKNWDEVMKNHLQLLEQNQAIKKAYLNNNLALLEFGLPVSIKDYGGMVVMRCQRAALQQWKETVPWAKAGQVTPVLAADIAKELGKIIPLNAVVAVNPPQDAMVYNPVNITKGNSGLRQVAMTFDCGSDAGPTPKIIYTLEKNNVQATFFITGQFAESYPDIVRQIAANKNLIGNHTYSHPHLLTCSDQKIREELEKPENIFSKLISQSIKPWWRSPYGEYDQRVLAVAAQDGYYKHVLWTEEMIKGQYVSADSGGWIVGSTAAQVQANIERALSKLGNDTITVMHCGSSSDADALGNNIRYMESSGFGIETVQQIWN